MEVEYHEVDQSSGGLLLLALGGSSVDKSHITLFDKFLLACIP